MKTHLPSPLLFLFIIALTFPKVHAQVSVKDINGQYLTSVTPNTGISYVLYAPTLNVQGCDVDWEATNSQDWPDGYTIKASGITYSFKWKNVQGNAVLKGTFRNCSTSSTNGQTATLSVPIRYLGDIGTISINGASGFTQEVPCGSQPVTITVGSALNATNYNWNLSSLAGWTINSGQGTNTINVTPSGGSTGQIIVTATRSDAQNTSSSRNVAVSRPSLANAAITGDSQGCLNQSGTYTLINLTSGISTNWSVSGSISLAGSTATNATINYGSTNGSGIITAQITDACTNTVTRTFNVGVGSPNISTINWDNSPNNGPVPASSGSTHYISVTSSNASSASYNLSVTNNFGDINTTLYGANGGNAEVYVTGTHGNSSINIYSSNVCGNKSSSLTVYIPTSMRAAPNPATSKMSIVFAETDYREALPDKLELISEKSQQTVRSINVDDVYTSGKLKDGDRISFDIGDLPRGVYYLKATNARLAKDKQTEPIRLVFN